MSPLVTGSSFRRGSTVSGATAPGQFLSNYLEAIRREGSSVSQLCSQISSYRISRRLTGVLA